MLQSCSQGTARRTGAGEVSTGLQPATNLLSKLDFWLKKINKMYGEVRFPPFPLRMAKLSTDKLAAPRAGWQQDAAAVGPCWSQGHLQGYGNNCW